MNLVDKLLKADTKKADELERGVYKSRKLARILGSKETVDVTIQEVKPRRITDIVAYQHDGKGGVDLSKTFDANLMMCIEGIVEPDLRNKELQEHFGCRNAKELCEKLFGMEANEISEEISRISGVGQENEAEIKN